MRIALGLSIAFVAYLVIIVVCLGNIRLPGTAQLR